ARGWWGARGRGGRVGAWGSRSCGKNDGASLARARVAAVTAAGPAGGPRPRPPRAPWNGKGPARAGPFRIHLAVGLPDPHAGVALADHRVAGRALERLGEGCEVGRRADRAEVRRRVRIGGDAHAQLRGGDVPAPDGGPVGEEALVAGQAVDQRSLGAFGGALHGVVGGGQAAQVGDVLAEGEL